MIELRKKPYFFNNIEKMFIVFVKMRFEVKRRQVTENIYRRKTMVYRMQLFDTY